jgi:biotin carboxylase
MLYLMIEFDSWIKNTYIKGDTMGVRNKKVMLLGGNYFQMTATKAAKRLGYYVVSVDYLPDNPAHKYADEYYNVSTLDKDAVFTLAKKLGIDGIVSYASDVSAPTAAYVAEKMGLPTNPLETVEIMTDKERFHPYLREKGFFVPKVATIREKQELEDFFIEVGGKIIIKPPHSSGSKGISVISNESELQSAYTEAVAYANGENLVAEQFIQRQNYQIAGDAFVVDGRIVYFGLANEHFDRRCNPLVPIGESFPANISLEQREKARKEIQNALADLGFKNGAVNLDFMFKEDGEIFIIELGPRNGGNLITDAISVAGNVDLAEYTIKLAVGDDVSDLVEENMDKFVSSYIWHAQKDGIFNDISISNELREKIILSDILVDKGTKIKRFDNGGFGLGAALLKFDSMEQMLYMMDHMEEFYEVQYK